MFEDLIINRNVHTRTLEGDGDKQSRHENAGPHPYTFPLFLIYDGRQPPTKISEILKFKSFEKRPEMHVFKFVLTSENG